MITIKEARAILTSNFIGPEELEKIGFKPVGSIPKIKYNAQTLKKLKKDYILILGVCITINHLRNTFGIDPQKGEPCMYNQDWYINEKFASTELKPKWYLISKNISEKTRGCDPKKINNKLLPSAVLATFTFFSYYLLNNSVIWKNDFLWCKDKDHNGDQIYVGRYIDPKGVNKNGFNIHRHLKINKTYGLAPSFSS